VQEDHFNWLPEHIGNSEGERTREDTIDMIIESMHRPDAA
jgi:hypothetical protein